MIDASDYLDELAECAASLPVLPWLARPRPAPRPPRRMAHVLTWVDREIADLERRQQSGTTRRMRALRRARAELVKATLVAVLLVLCAACARTPQVPPVWTPTPSLLAQARRVEVPWAEWLAGYAGAEVCSGKRGDVRKVRWHIVPGQSFSLHPGGPRLLGMTSGDDIFLAEAVAHWIWLSRHEGLHHVRVTNHTNHPPALFVGRCAADWPTPRDTL